MRRIFPVLLALACACLPYRGERRAAETWTVLDPAARPLTGLDVRLSVVEGNCMALSNAQTGRIIEQVPLKTDAAGRIRTESEGAWRMNPCVFKTDQGTCVRHCYSIDHPEFAPLDTCEEETAVSMPAGTIKLSRPKFPRWSSSMRKSYRESCRTVPYVKSRATDAARYCDCLERRLDGSIQEDRFLRMSDAEVEAMLPGIDGPCRLLTE